MTKKNWIHILRVFVKKTYALKNYYFDIRYQILFKIPSLIFKDKIRYHNCPSQKNENKNEWFINYKFENSFSNFSSTKYCEKCLLDDFDFKIALPYIKKNPKFFKFKFSKKEELNNLALKHYCIIFTYSFNIHILSSES